MTSLEKNVNDINETFFLPLLSQEMWQEDFTSAEYIEAKEFIQPYTIFFKEEDIKLVVQVLKSQIKCMRWWLGNFRSIDESEFQEDSLEHLEFKKNIPNFIKLIRCFQFAKNSGNIKTDLAFEAKTKLFDITKITFEGERKGNKIVLEGKIIELIRHFFDALGNIREESDLDILKLISEDLHNQFWYIWFDHIAKKSLVKRNITAKSVQQLKNEMKMMRCFQFHRFLCQHSSINDGKKITENEKRFIGDFLILTGFCQDTDSNSPNFLDTVHYNDVRNWIVRGNYF